MKSVITIAASVSLLVATFGSIHPAIGQAATKDDAGRALTGLLMLRCESTNADPAASSEQKRFACNPGRAICAPTIDGGNACASISEMPRACRLVRHPEWYGKLDHGDQIQEFDEGYFNLYAHTYVEGRDWVNLLASPTLPAVTTERSSSPWECGTKEEQKPVWVCTRKTKKHKRKCRKVKPKPIVVSAPSTPTPDDGAVSQPHNDPATKYASAVGSLVAGCSRTSLTYSQVERNFRVDPTWTTKCSVLYYDKLKANWESQLSTQYPSRLIVQQVENVYLRKTGSPTEIANLECWSAWWNATPKPIPSGCAG